MAPGVPARMVFLCVVLTGVGTTRADGERHKVAVIDLSGDPAAVALREAMYTELVGHWALISMGKVAIDALLQGNLGDDAEEALIAQARRLRDQADTAVQEPNYSSAQTEAEEGKALLLKVAPSTGSIGLFADLEISRAIADIGLQRPADATRRFALAYRLNPQKTLDSAHYLPDFVDAFEAAKKAPTAPASVDVKGTGRVWIDGKDVGPAPGKFDVVAGDHLVQLAGADRETIGIEVTVPRANNAPVEIADAPASEELLIKRARLALSRVPDAAARASAMTRLADLLGVHDAVLISKNDDDKLVIQTWKDHECLPCPSPDPGFSRPTIVGNEKPIDLLAPLSPPKPPDVVKPIPFVVPPIVVEQQWYEKRWVQGSIATGAIAAIVGGILWARHVSHVGVDPNAQFETMAR